MSLPHDIEMRISRRHHLRSTRHQFWGRAHSVLLFASPLLPLFADWCLRQSFSDLSADAPAAVHMFWLAMPAGFILYLCMRWEGGAGVCRRIAQAGWIAAAAATIVYLGIGAQDHRGAAAGPVLRAQVVSVKRQGRHGPLDTLFALQDGSTVHVVGHPGGRNCYAVRRLEGAHGFAWLRIVEAAPGPEAGQLDWPIDRVACFSAAPLASLRG